MLHIVKRLLVILALVGLSGWCAEEKIDPEGQVQSVAIPKPQTGAEVVAEGIFRNLKGYSLEFAKGGTPSFSLPLALEGDLLKDINTFNGRVVKVSGTWKILETAQEVKERNKKLRELLKDGLFPQETELPEEDVWAIRVNTCKVIFEQIPEKFLGTVKQVNPVNPPPPPDLPPDQPAQAPQAKTPLPKAAPFCAGCAKKYFVMMLGRCSACPNETGSASFKFCTTCAANRGVCPACGKKP